MVQVFSFQSVYTRRFTADSVEVEIIVALSASIDQEAIAQSRCLGLIGMNIYLYKRDATMQCD